jgi:hypothetical protein
MKKLLLMATFGLAALFACPAEAQVSVNVNIGAQPAWGPAGYNHVDYYYLPEVETYYYVPTRTFISMNGNKWVKTKHLPARHRGYDLHRGRKVVINSPRPYLRHDNYRSKYGYASYAPQRESKQRVVYRDYPEAKHHNKKTHKHKEHRGHEHGARGRH